MLLQQQLHPHHQLQQLHSNMNQQSIIIILVNVMYLFLQIKKKLIIS